MTKENISTRLTGKKALCLMAHPDDETIWMGGTMLQNKKTDWTCFSLCRASDIDRAPKFKRVCEYYSAKSILTDLDDDNDIALDKVVKMVKVIVEKELQNQEFDCLFTHGENGEYGHERHVAVHIAIKELAREGFFKKTKIYFLNYRKRNEDEEFFEMMPDNDSTDLIQLTTEEYQQKKKEVMAGIYGFDADGIDVNLCTRVEAFKSLEYL